MHRTNLYQVVVVTLPFDSESIAAICLIALSGLFPPNLIDQSSCMILTTHAKTRPILHDDWSVRLGENRLYRSSQTFGGYADSECNVFIRILIHI